MAVANSRTAAIPCTEFRFTSADGLCIQCAKWNGSPPVQGVVQIAHGMGEHLGRYSLAIEVLVSAGLTVYGNDHRGHGRTAPSTKHLGDFGAGGFDLLVEDMVRLSRIAREDNPGRSLILLGHSMGSFAAQQFVLDHSQEIDGLALSGSGDLDRIARAATSAPPGTNLLNAAFEPARTPFEWLSRDTEVVDAFMNDPLAFAQLQPASLASFLAAAPRLSDPISLRKIRSELPIYLFSGSEDPVGRHLEGVELLIARYGKAGIREVSCDLYPGGRHEMLNEINRNQVLANLLSWISRTLGIQSRSRNC